MTVGQLAAREPSATWVWPLRSLSARAALFLLVALSYAVGSRLALMLIDASGLDSVFFIPAGITVALLLRLPTNVWWVVVAAAGTAEGIMDLLAGYTVGQAAGFAVANMAEPIVGASIVTRAVGRVDLARRRHVLWFTLGAVIIAPAVGGGIGALAFGSLEVSDLLARMWQWGLGDALGVVLVAGAILAWGSSPDWRPLISWAGAALVGGSILLTIGIFSLTDLPLVFSVLIGVVVAGELFGVRAVATTALVVAGTIAIHLAVDPGAPGGLIAGLSDATALLIVKVQVGLFTLAGLVVAAEALERELATEDAVRTAARAVLVEAARQQEHDVVIRLQEALLPPITFRHDRIDVAVRYEAGSDTLEVGGDWYDILELPGGRVGLVVGDVVGHGVEATAAMGHLRTGVAALAPHRDGPADLLGDIDDFATGAGGSEYATMSIAFLDPATGVVRYASAGHPPILVIDPSGDTRWLERGRSAPICLAGDRPRAEATETLAPGTTLILYTDGLIERRDESLDLGMDRLAQAAQRLGDKPVETVCERLMSELGVADARGDDVVVLAVRLRHAPIDPLDTP